MHWIIQSNMFSEEGHGRLLEALNRLGVKYTEVKVIPFGNELEPELVISGGNVVVMGTYTLCRIAKSRGWAPGSFENDNFNYNIQSAYWPMLNGDAGTFRFKDVPEQLNPFFIRPLHDSKSFTGFVTDWPSFAQWREGVLKPSTGEEMTGDTLVIINRVKEIYREYRLWVVDGRIVTASKYKEGRIPKQYSVVVDEGVIEFGKACISKWVPARAFVMDIAETSEGYRVVEVNNLNSAGFYAGDMNKLVMAIEGMRF